MSDTTSTFRSITLPNDALIEVALVTHQPLNEISGVVRSETYEDVWWVHNDSGDEPRIFAIDSVGRLVMPPWRRDHFYTDHAETDKQPWPGIRLLGASNQDWEDVALAEGVLYVSDMGNNGNAKRDLGIYALHEPNPAAMDQGARVLKFIPVVYPDQDAYPPADWRFDCEAVFWSDGLLYLLTKYRADSRFDRITTGTSLYRLDTTHADRVNRLTLLHRADALPIIPTGADLSPDGKVLAVSSYDGIWLFERPADGDDWLGGVTTRIELPNERIKQVEGVCWDDAETVRLVNEQRQIFTLNLGSLQSTP